MGWIIATCLLGLALIGVTWFSAHVIVKLITQRMDFEEELEARVDMSLRALDACHDQIAMVANKPVFFDSPEVRQVVKAVKDARRAVVEVIEIFEDIEVDENEDRVDVEEIKNVSDVDPHNPKSTAELDKETRAELLQKARRGEIDVLTPQRTQHQEVQDQFVPRRSPSAAKAAAAIARHQQRQRERAQGKSNG